MCLIPAKSRGRIAQPYAGGADLWTEALTIFTGDYERLDHLGGLIVSAKLIQFPKPEVISVYVAVRWIVRVSPQIAEVLHQDKRVLWPRLCPIDLGGNLQAK